MSFRHLLLALAAFGATTTVGTRAARADLVYGTVRCPDCEAEPRAGERIFFYDSAGEWVGDSVLTFAGRDPSDTYGGSWPDGLAAFNFKVQLPPGVFYVLYYTAYHAVVVSDPDEPRREDVLLRPGPPMFDGPADLVPPDEDDPAAGAGCSAAPAGTAPRSGGLVALVLLGVALLGAARRPGRARRRASTVSRLGSFARLAGTLRCRSAAR